jgi:hypothetical protein
MFVFVIMCTANLAFENFSSGYSMIPSDLTIVVYFTILAWAIGRFSQIKSDEFKSH